MKTVYLLEGRTGEYEDRVSWIVCAFTRQEPAQDMMRLLAKLSSQLDPNTDYEAIPVSISEYYYRRIKRIDPQFHIDYTGTFYRILETQLLETKEDMEGWAGRNK